MKARKILVSVLCVLLSVWMFACIPASAISTGYYNSYDTIAMVHDQSYDGTNITSMQGCAVGTTYVYSVKIRETKDSDGNVIDTKQMLCMTKIDDGTTTVLKNAANNKYYTTILGHANDMTVCSCDGYSTLFVATVQKGSYSLVRLKITKGTYIVTGHYTLKLNRANKEVAGVAVKFNDVTGRKVNLLLKSGSTFYNATIPYDTNSGSVSITKAFSINRNSVVCNGVTINTTDYYNQGFGYYKNYIFVPLSQPGATDSNGYYTSGNISIIAVYNIAGATSNSTLTSSNTLSFRINSTLYKIFEIESCGIHPTTGRLIFNTNRARQKGTVTNYWDFDSIHYATKADGTYFTFGS